MFVYDFRPFEPHLNPYLHLAALFGHNAVCNVLITNRPEDFRITSQPLFVPKEFLPSLCLNILGIDPKLEETPLTFRDSSGKSDMRSSNKDRISTSGSCNTSRLGSPVEKKSQPFEKLLFVANSSFMNLSRSINQVNTVFSNTKGYTGNNVGETGEVRRQGNSVVAKKEDSVELRRRMISASVKKDKVVVTMEEVLSVLNDVSIDGSKPSNKSPLHVAAVARQLRTAKILLDRCVLKEHPHLSSTGYLNLAAVAHCDQTLTLILKVRNIHLQIDLSMPKVIQTIVYTIIDFTDIC